MNRFFNIILASFAALLLGAALAGGIIRLVESFFGSQLQPALHYHEPKKAVMTSKFFVVSFVGTDKTGQALILSTTNGCFFSERGTFASYDLEKIKRNVQKQNPLTKNIQFVGASVIREEIGDSCTPK